MTNFSADCDLTGICDALLTRKSAIEVTIRAVGVILMTVTLDFYCPRHEVAPRSSHREGEVPSLHVK